MSALTELKAAWETKDHSSDALYGAFCRAYPDIKRVTEWVAGVDHGFLCGASDGPCICGLDAIRKLLED